MLVEKGFHVRGALLMQHVHLEVVGVEGVFLPIGLLPAIAFQFGVVLLHRLDKLWCQLAGQA